jgi:hypothetical protein
VEKLVADPPAIRISSVLFWFRSLGVLISLVAILCVGIGIVMAGRAIQWNGSAGKEFLFVAIALIVAVGYSVPLWVSTSRSWLWWYGLALLLLALVSLYFTIFALPLLAFWLSSDVKSYFTHAVNPGEVPP